MVGGVGQRVLSGVAKKTAGEFFKAVDDVLTGKAPSVPAPRGEAAVPVGAAAETPGVFTAPAAAPGGPFGREDFMWGVVLGAAAALAGAIVGGLVARRRSG